MVTSGFFLKAVKNENLPNFGYSHVKVFSSVTGGGLL